MEDSTAKTIDYLRARLLAERSVSSTARQRAYELAKRVTELEKQLKYVSQQRKKAEKATVDVLAILENHGRNDLSESFDSSSDQEEASSDFKDGKHVEKSENNKIRGSDTEGFSGSEVESSSVNGRSLSWKSSKNSSSRFLDKKYLEASRRRRNSFTSTGSSPRRVGKSCRQIRHKEHRSATDGSQNDDATNGVQNSADVAPETSLNIHEEKDSLEVPTSSCNGHAVKNYGTEREMEKALKHQAQFIAQYEEEEKAQREWEDKFRENNGSPPDSCDPGTHSDVTEERDEIKATPAPSHPPSTPPPSIEKPTPRTQESNTNFNEEPKTDTEPSPNIDPNNEPSNNQNQNQNHPPELEGTPQNFSPIVSSSSQDQTTGKSHENPDNLVSVLEALQQAKLSLKQNLDIFPLLENGPAGPSYRSRDKFTIPFSPTAGLFRLPTDYEFGGTGTGTMPRANSLTYDPRLSLTNYPSDHSENRFMSSPYRESFSRSTTSLDDRYRMVPTFPYQETMPEMTRLPPSTSNPRLDINPSSSLDPRLSVVPGPRPFLDPRLGVRQTALDPRSNPRLVMGPSVDPRLGVGPSVDPRFAVRQTALDTQLGLGVRQSAFDPRLETGPQYTGDRYTRSGDHPHSSAGLPPLDYTPSRTRSLYDGYTR